MFDGSPAGSPSLKAQLEFPFPRDSLSRFGLACASPALALCVLWYGLRNPLTEAADKIYFLGALAAGALVFFARVPKRSSPISAGVSLLGLAVMLWGTLSIEHVNLLGMFWLGFGKRVALLALALIPLVGFLLRPHSELPRAARVLGYCVLALVLGIGALSFFQTRTSLLQPDHSAYIFNELYALPAGHVPYRDFVPQYQTLFSYLFYPLIEVLGVDRALNPILCIFWALSMATVACGVLAGWMATRGLNRLFAPLLILPIVFLTQGPERRDWIGSIGTLHSAYPVRMLWPTLLGVLLAQLPALGVQAWQPRRHLLPFGFLIGLGCFHQIDFGLAAAVAAGTVIVMAQPWARLPRILSLWAAAVCAGFLAVPLLHWLADVPLAARRVGWFVRQFGGGFGSEPIQIPGPVLLVLPLLVGCTVTCLAALRAQRASLAGGSWTELGLMARLAARSPRNAPSEPPLASAGLGPDLLPVRQAALIGSYFGVFAVAAFPYYLNRSYASGQLQILLLPLGISLAATVQLIVGSREWEEQRRSLGSLMLRLSIAVPIASLLLLPSPRHEWDRLQGEHAETHWPGPKTAAIVALGQGWKRLGSYDAVGYFGTDGNYIEAMTGLHNVTVFNNPLDGSMSRAALQELCGGIVRKGLSRLILGEYGLNPSLCPGGDNWSIQRSKSGIVVATREARQASQH
jgi:hypothetical protein